MADTLILAHSRRLERSERAGLDKMIAAGFGIAGATVAGLEWGILIDAPRIAPTERANILATAKKFGLDVTLMLTDNGLSPG